MVTAQDLVDSSTKADLVDQAEDLGLETSGLNKTELAEAILAAEEEEFATPEPEPTDEAEPEVEEVADEAPEPESEPKAADSGGDEILVRFVGKNPTLQTEGFTFKASNPFRVMSEDDAERVFEGYYGDKFRVATPKEAKEFYS